MHAPALTNTETAQLLKDIDWIGGEMAKLEQANGVALQAAPPQQTVAPMKYPVEAAP
jgi:hypothetical protein